MKIVGYATVWLVLIVATGLELALFGMPLTPLVVALGIFGLAGIKAILIAMFYQHLVGEPKSVSILYLVGLLAAMGLIGASIISLFR